jgi:hypothetical protein
MLQRNRRAASYFLARCRLITICVLLFCCLSACAVGPDFIRPTAALWAPNQMCLQWNQQLVPLVALYETVEPLAAQFRRPNLAKGHFSVGDDGMVCAQALDKKLSVQQVTPAPAPERGVPGNRMQLSMKILSEREVLC